MEDIYLGIAGFDWGSEQNCGGSGYTTLMASSVPVVPAGVDPFMVYQQAIDDIFYRKPTAGFRARLYVLGSLVVS